MDMVEKTRRSLTVLRRCQEADREELNHWIRRYSDAEDMKKGSSPAPRPHNSTASTEAPPLGTQAGAGWACHRFATGRGDVAPPPASVTCIPLVQVLPPPRSIPHDCTEALSLGTDMGRAGGGKNSLFLA